MKTSSLVIIFLCAVMFVNGSPSKVSFNADSSDGLYVFKDSPNRQSNGVAEVNCLTISNSNYPALPLLCELFRELSFKLKSSNVYSGEKFALFFNMDEPESHFGLNSYYKRSLDSIGGGHLIRRSVL